MSHLNENTYMLMTNVISEIVAIARKKEKEPGPFTYEEDFALNKAMGVRRIALSEASLAGIIPPSPPGAKS